MNNFINMGTCPFGVSHIFSLNNSEILDIIDFKKVNLKLKKKYSEDYYYYVKCKM